MNELLLAATLVCCLGICIRLLTYRPAAQARYRPGIALCAWLLVASTGGQALHILLQGTRGVGCACQLMVLVVLLIATCRARGNVAHLFGMN